MADRSRSRFRSPDRGGAPSGQPHEHQPGGVEPGGNGTFNASGNDEVKLYVGNLSSDVARLEDIASLFREYGNVLDCFMPTADHVTQKGRGYCFVTMPAAEAETACNELNGKEFDARVLRVNKAQPSADRHAGGDAPDPAPAQDSDCPDRVEAKLYVGNLDYATDEQRLREEFSRFGAAVTDVYLPRERGTSRIRGFGFVTLATWEAAERAISKMDKAQLDGRQIRVSESATPKGERRPAGVGPGGNGTLNASGKDEVKLYVGNLSSNADKVEDLARMFQEYGKVLDCVMPTTKCVTQKCRGFCFVTMPAAEAETACNELNGKEFDGRVLTVQEARPPADRDADGDAPAPAPARGERQTGTEPGGNGTFNASGGDLVKLYVGNISSDFSGILLGQQIKDISRVFREYGSVLDCFMPIDPATDRGRGFCFVTMPAAEAEIACNELNGREFDERVLTVQEAQPSAAYMAYAG